MCLNSYTHRVSALNEKFLIVFGKRELKQASQLKPNFLTMFRCWTLFLFNTFLAAYRGMWDVSSLTRDWTSAPCIGSVVSTTGPPGEVPRGTLLSNKLGFILLLFWRRKWQLTPISLAGEFQGQRSLVSYSPWGHRVRHNRATNTHIHQTYWSIVLTGNEERHLLWSFQQLQNLKKVAMEFMPSGFETFHSLIGKSI